jgi:hypothetical protein
MECYQQVRLRRSRNATGKASTGARGSPGSPICALGNRCRSPVAVCGRVSEIAAVQLRVSVQPRLDEPVPGISQLPCSAASGNHQAEIKALTGKPVGHIGEFPSVWMCGQERQYVVTGQPCHGERTLPPVPARAKFPTPQIFVGSARRVGRRGSPGGPPSRHGWSRP